MKQKVFRLLEDSDYRPGRVVQTILISLIVLNVAAEMIQSVEEMRARWARPLDVFEAFSVGVFTIEYLLRAWVSTCKPGLGRPIRGRLRYLVTPLAILDLMAILPFYLPMLMPFDLRFLRAMRILRLGKFGRYSSSVRILQSVLSDRRAELMATLSILAMVVVLASGLMYVVEHEAQPHVFRSIPATMYYAAATLTTMAYADMKPVTWVGQILASCIAVCGIGLFALPAGILGSGFVEKYMEQRRDRRCPHCGKSLDEQPAGTEPEEVA